MQKQKNLDWNNELKQIAKWAREKKEKSKSVSFKYSLNEFRPLASSIDSSDIVYDFLIIEVAKTISNNLFITLKGEKTILQTFNI